MEPKRVIGIDIEDYRLRMAEKAANSETLNAKETNVIEAIRDMTDGRGADVCIDAVGLEADRSLMDKLSNIVHMQAGFDQSARDGHQRGKARRAYQRGGSLWHAVRQFPLGQIFDKGLHLHFGQATVQPFFDELIGWVNEGKIRLDDIITHKLPLADAAKGYEIFAKKQDNCVKVVLNP